MAKHKAATEITIAQEEQSAFAAMVFKYKWPALTTLAVASAAILYVQSASEAATESKRAEWGQLFEASSSDDPIVALEEFTAQNPEGAAAASAFMNQALLHLDDGDYEGATEALMSARATGPALLASLEFPIGEDDAGQSLIAHLAASVESGDKETAAKAVELLYDAALVTGGFAVESPREFAGRIYAMIESAVAK